MSDYEFAAAAMSAYQNDRADTRRSLSVVELLLATIDLRVFKIYIAIMGKGTSYGVLALDSIPDLG